MIKNLRNILFHTVLVLSVLGGGVLSGCSEYEQVNNTVEETEKEVDKAFDRIMPRQNIRKSLVVDQRPWYGSKAIPMLNGNPLPARFQQKNAVVMTFSQGVSFRRAAQMIQSVTGIRVQMGQSVLGDNARSREIAATQFMPVDAEEVTGGRFVWQGRLSDLLDQVADAFGSDWSYDGRMIRFNSEVTRTFMLHALATTFSNTGAIESGAGDDSGSLPELDLNSDTPVGIWAEIEEAVESIIGRAGQVAFSPSTGTITVTGSPEILRRVERYLQQQNSMRLRRIAIAIKVLNVTLSNEFSFEADLQGMISEVINQTTGLRAESLGADGLSLILRRNKPGTTGFTAADSEDAFLSGLELSEDIDRISIAHSGSVVTLSDMPAPLQVGRQIAYLERISSSGDANSGQLSLEPGTVNEGLTMIAVPRIVEKDRVLLRLNVAITDAIEPFATFGQGGANGGGQNDALLIQLPEIETTGFLQNAVLHSGEMMVLAGFERKQDSLDDRGAPGGLWTGGSRATNRSRNMTVLMITSEILPEEPMSVLGR